MSPGDAAPQRTPGELLELVRAKADRIRWRRRLVGAGGSIVLVAGILAAVALARPGPGQRHVQTLGEAPTAAGSTTTLPPPTATLSPPTTPPPGIALPPATTTAPPTTAPPKSPPPTNAVRVTTTSVAPTVSTTSAPPPPCTADKLALTVATDQSSYPVGATVKIHLALTNLGSQTCALAQNPGIEIIDPTGRKAVNILVGDLCPPYGTVGTPPYCPVDPYKPFPYDVTWAAPGQCGAIPACAPGVYTAQATWVTKGTASFRLT